MSGDGARKEDAGDGKVEGEDSGEGAIEEEEEHEDDAGAARMEDEDADDGEVDGVDCEEGAMEEEEEDAGERVMEGEEEEDAGEGGMEGEEEMEGEEDSDSIDFHPFFLETRSPSADRESGESSTKVREAEENADDEEELADEGQEEDGSFETEECVQQMFSGSEEFIGELDGEDKFFQLATDYDYEEEELDDVEQDEKDREYLEGCLNGMDYGETCCVEDEEEEDATAYQILDRLDGKGSIVSGGNIMCGTQDKFDEDYKLDEDYIAPEILQLEEELVRSDESEGEREEPVDPICRRTRARYSLTDMSLDQLETFLQGSDEEDDFQTMDDREEYEKFLRAVLEKDVECEKPEQSGRKEDEDDEEEDVDFEIEIEEALESDDASESVRRRKRKRPETREKRLQRAQFQSRGPLRQLLPHMGNFANDGSKRNVMTETVNITWPTNGKRRAAPVGEFTAHQIGQLYCLMHEHVQLLVQVHSLCVWDPAREQLAKETHGMLLELVKEREKVLSWKKTAFKDFCFRPPYTHPSTAEGVKTTLLHSLSPPDPTHTSTSYGQSAPFPSNTNFPSTFVQFPVLPPQAYPFPQNVERFTASAPEIYSALTISRQASRSTQHYATRAEYCSQQSTVTSQSWQEGAHPLGASWNPGSDQRQRAAQSVPGGASSSLTRTLTGAASYSTVTSPSEVDHPGRLMPRLLESPEYDPTSLNYCWSSGTSSGAEISPGVVNREAWPSVTMVQTTPLREGGGQMCNKPLTSGLPNEGVIVIEWAPIVTGTVHSILDVAPLPLVRDFLIDMAQAVQEYKQRHVEGGASRFEREPLFAMTFSDEQDHSIRRNVIEGTRSRLSGDVELVLAPQIKKTMAAALVESTKKESISPVPTGVAVAVQRFLPYFNKAMFPHKAPPLSTSSRLLFTEAEDELLAMGMMEFNHEWKLIQQRYLPCKTEHQVKIRAKNRSSTKAFANSIKAVHQFKTSPLTDLEKKSIHEGLSYYKHDWDMIWRYCVPHRDPTTLQRQYRTAIGTQKSYKTSETSKERRRLYEASRRQKVAALKASNNAPAATEDAHPSGTGIAVEGSNFTTENKDSDDPDGAHIREIFIEDRHDGSTPIISSGPTLASLERQQRKLLSKRRKPKTQPDTPVSSSRPWLDSQTASTISNSNEQTVRLAPDLPLVKLPSHVQVLSQSQVQPQQPFPLAKRAVLASSQWGERTSQGLEKPDFCVPALNLQPLTLPNCATEVTTLQGGLSTSHEFTVPSIQTNRRRGQTSLKKKSRQVHLSPVEDRRNAPMFRLSGDSAMPNDLPFQNLCVGTSFPPATAECYRLPADIESLLAQRRKEMTENIPTDHVGSDYQDERAYATVLSTPMDSIHCRVSQVGAAATSGTYPRSDFCGLQSPIQASSCAMGPPPLVDPRVKLKVRVATEIVIPGSDVPVDVMQMLDGKKNSKTRRNPVKRNKKAVSGTGSDTRNDNRGTSISPSVLKGSQQFRTFLTVGGISDQSTSNSHFGSRNTGRNRTKDRKQQDPFVEEGSQEPLADQHIVMEQEELSDSEDEPDAGVEFEHEEMGDDSDRETETEV